MIIIESQILNSFTDVKFGFSGKYGLGKKSPHWFNMSYSVGENKEEVNANRKAFLNELGLDYDNLAWQKQIHSNRIKIVNKPGFQGENDALITTKRGIVISAFSADCTTIFLYEAKKKIIAAVHSGWRGTAKKILPKVLQLLSDKFNASKKNLFAFIAPAISQKNYEVGKDTASFFDDKYLIHLNNGKYLLDVSRINYDYLIDFGIPKKNIEFSKLCSFEADFLHSYRRDKQKSGRAIGVVSLI